MKEKRSSKQSQYWTEVILLVLFLLIALAVSSELSNAGGDEEVHDDMNNIKLTPNRKSSLQDKSSFDHSQHHLRHGQHKNHLPLKNDAGGERVKKRNPILNELDEEVGNQNSGEAGEEEGSEMEGPGHGEEGNGGEKQGVHYHFHRKTAHQEVEGEAEEGEQGGVLHHHSGDADDDHDNHLSGASGSGGHDHGHDHAVEEIHIHHDQSQHIESHHPTEDQGVKSEWQHVHGHDLSGDHESGNKDFEGSHSADGENSQGVHKETLHIHQHVHRHHGDNVQRNSSLGHQHEDEASDSEGDREHSGDHVGKLEPERGLGRGVEESEKDDVHHEHSAEGAFGDHGKEMEKHIFEEEQVHKVKHKAVNPGGLNAAKHHHVHINHQHQGLVQKSTAFPHTEAASEAATEAASEAATEVPTKLKRLVENEDPEVPDSDIYIDENKRAEDEGELHEVEIVRANQQEVSCSRDDRTITNGTVVYIREECRLCQCVTGTLQCEAMSASCTNHKALSCMLERGGMLNDADIHFDGCNRCLCRNGELLCTRLRCKSSGYNYTDYARFPDKLDRGIDPCLACDRAPISVVCGPNGKTYRSLCHAFLCAGLKLQDLELGACEDLDPCQNHVCKGKNEICMADKRTPCLAVENRAGKKLNCLQYKCVAIKDSCPLQSDPDQVVCGIDGQTYPTECHLVSNSVLLAYRGSCRKACSDGDYQVCGVDAVTFASPCQANLYNQYVDYQGPCETFAAKPDVIIQEHGPDLYVNRRCSRLDKKTRCPDLTCQEVVTPPGTCCPVCGAALSIRLDTAAQDMIDLKVVRPAQDLNSLDAVFTAIANLQDASTLGKCRITVDLADTNDIVATFVPKSLYDLKYCTDAARNTVKKVYSKTDSFDPYQALLASAVLVELDESGESVVAKDGVSKRRVKRTVHHEHEPVFPSPGNTTSTAVAPEMTRFSCFVTLILSSLMILQ